MNITLEEEPNEYIILQAWYFCIIMVCGFFYIDFTLKIISFFRSYNSCCNTLCKSIYLLNVWNFRYRDVFYWNLYDYKNSHLFGSLFGSHILFIEFFGILAYWDSLKHSRDSPILRDHMGLVLKPIYIQIIPLILSSIQF